MIKVRDLLFLCLGISIGVLIFYIFNLSHKQVPTYKPITPSKEESFHLKRLQTSLYLLHQPMGNPSPGEWLYEKKETGQSFAEYICLPPVQPTKERSKIYIQPLGNLSNTQKGILIITADYLHRFYDLQVEISDPISTSLIPDSLHRMHQGFHQVNSLYILNQILKSNLPKDAAAYIAFTNLDLYPKKSWNFVFGQANIKSRVGVYSLARYGNPDENVESYRKCLARTLKVASHETGHMFSIKHCINYKCNMNGSNSLHESDNKPHYLCPEDLFKLCWNMEIDELYRFRQMAAFWKEHNYQEMEEFYNKSIHALENHPNQEPNSPK